MSPNLARVLVAAESLSAAERRELVTLLLEGLDDSVSSEGEPGTAGLTEAWRQEIARRSAEYDAGEAETVNGEEIQQRWQARRAARG